MQIIANPNVTSSYSPTYPEAPADLVIPKTVTDGEKVYTVTTIGYRAFFMCSQLTSVTLPDTIRVIGDYAFQTAWSNAKLTEMNLPEGLEEIGSNALYGLPVDFKLPSTLKRIGASAFVNTGITEVHFGDAIEAVGDRAFMRCTKLVKAEVTEATQYTEGLYLNCTALTDVTIADGVTILPENCFFGCSSLTHVTLPESVTELGKSVFYGCDFSSLDFLNTGSVTTLGDFCFAGNDNLHDIVIPDSVTYVGANQFYWCKYVAHITFGEKVAYVGKGVMSTFFIDTSVTSVVPEVRSATAGAAVRRSGYVGAMTRDGVNFDVYCGAPFVVDGITYMPISANEVQVTGYEETLVYGSVTIPETVTCEGDETTYTVTSIADKVFFKKYNIIELHLPDTLATVGERSFDQIYSLNYINIPKGLTTASGIQAFGYGGWDNLTCGEWLEDTLYIPATLRTWNQCLFSGNKYTKAVLEEGLHMVGAYGVSNNNNLAEVELASTVQYLKNNAFSSCPALTDITFAEGLLYIGNNAFQGDPLKSIVLPDSVQYVGTQAFEALKYDYSTYPSTVTYVGPAEIRLGGGVTGLGWNAFYKDARLTAVLGSQQNLLVERCDFTVTPGVVWDGKTSIPAGDWSIVPAGTELTVSGDVRIDGALYIEDGATVTVPEDASLTIGLGAQVDESKISWIRVSPVEPVVSLYTINVAGAANGSVSASRNSAYEGAAVYLTVKSADGYVLDTLTVTAADGSAVAVADKGNGRWTFEMPGANVTVSASFRKDTVFTDIDGHWYTEAINWAVEQGIAVDDEGTGLFRPEDVCTRASMVTFLWRAAGCPEPTIANPFTDVSESDAWYKAALWACEMGITKGYGSKDTFAPNAVSTRAQTVLFLQRAVKAADGSVNDFTDVPAGSYYEGAVSWAAENGITNGTSTGVFSPAADCYRGQIITFLYRLYKDR